MLTLFINVILMITEAILGLRFVLRLLGASSGAPFVRWVYETSQPLIQPFTGMFPSPVLDGRFVFEFITLFALVIYALIAYLIVELIHFIEHATRPHAIASERRHK